MKDNNNDVIISNYQYKQIEDELREINLLLCLFTEWFCSLDSIMYNSNDTMRKCLEDKAKIMKNKEEPYISYKQDFNKLPDGANYPFIVDLRIYLDKYMDRPTVSYNDNKKKIYINYNIKCFNYPGMIPYDKVDEKTVNKVLKETDDVREYLNFPNNFDKPPKNYNKWNRFRRIEDRISKYRENMMYSLSNVFLYLYSPTVKDVIYNLCLKKKDNVQLRTIDKWILGKSDRLAMFYAKIIETNTPPGFANVYYFIRSFEYITKLSKGENVLKLWSIFGDMTSDYLYFKNFFFIRKHMCTEEKCDVSFTGDSETTDIKDFNCVSFIDNDAIYLYVVLDKKITMYSGIET